MAEQTALRLLRKQYAHAKEIFQQEGLTSALARLLRAARVVFRTALCIVRVKLRKSKATPEQLVDWVFRQEDIRPIQIRSELIKLIEILQHEKSKTLIEIGTARGGTLLLFCLTADENATIISIDLPGGEFGGGYPEWMVPLYRAFARRNQRIYLLRTDSHSEAALQQVRAILGGREVDFLFIDGDHTHEGVKSDYDIYSPLVKGGGTIGFHDIAIHAPDSSYGVRLLWEDLKVQHEHREIIENPDQRGYGIGLLRKDTQTRPQNS